VLIPSKSGRYARGTGGSQVDDNIVTRRWSVRDTCGMRLWLLRHAKSSWDRPGLDDRERPLARRGARAVVHLRAYLEAEEIHPDLVLCSSALRTRETLAHVLPALGTELTIRIEPRLYGADPAELLEIVRGVPDVGGVLLIGHNPGIQEFAIALASRGDRLDVLTTKFPTGALAEIRLPDGAWGDVAEGSGELTRFVTPRELEPG
jgi:phosphohistidine phosphatase